MTTELTGYWTFFCNPAKWEIDLFLATHLEYDSYQVNDWYKNSTKVGQLGVIRVGVDERTKTQLMGREKLRPGIYAVVEILDEPQISSDFSSFYTEMKYQRQERPLVKIRYLKNLLNKPLLLESLRQNSTVKQDQYLMNGFQRSSMPLRKDAFDEILNILGAGDEIINNIQIEAADTRNEIEKLELKYQNASPQVKEIISRRIERGMISSVIKRYFNYKCKICEALNLNPHSFKKRNGEYYIETHHINHVASLKQGSLGVSNLIIVCANHHRQFHYGDIEIIENTSSELIISIDNKIITIEKSLSSLNNSIATNEDGTM